MLILIQILWLILMIINKNSVTATKKLVEQGKIKEAIDDVQKMYTLAVWSKGERLVSSQSQICKKYCLETVKVDVGMYVVGESESK